MYGPDAHTLRDIRRSLIESGARSVAVRAPRLTYLVLASGLIAAALVLAILAVFVLNYWVASRSLSEPPRIAIPYSPLFLNEVRQGNVDRITSKGTSLQGLFRNPVRYPPTGSSAKRFSTLIPSFADTAALSKLLEDNNVVINAEPLQSAAAWWETLLYGFGPTFLLIGLLVLLMRRTGRGALGSFGRSRARRYEASAERVTFDDVAGIEEAKDELTEIVDFLKNPQRYGRLGGRIALRIDQGREVRP